MGAGVLAHWKTFSFTQSDDDQIISIAGGIRYQASVSEKIEGYLDKECVGTLN